MSQLRPYPCEPRLRAPKSLRSVAVVEGQDERPFVRKAIEALEEEAEIIQTMSGMQPSLFVCSSELRF